MLLRRPHLPAPFPLLVGILALAGCAGHPAPIPEPVPPAAPPFVDLRRLDGSPDLTGPRVAGRPGDWLLENQSVVAVVAAGPACPWFLSGGDLLDAGPRGGADLVRGAMLALGAGFLRQAVYDTVFAEAAGDSSERVLTARGYDAGDPGISVETRYRLRMGEDRLRIATVLVNSGEDTVTAYPVADMALWGGAATWLPGTGPGPLADGTGAPFLLAEDRGSGAAWIRSGGALTVHGAAGWTRAGVVVPVLAPGDSVAFERSLVLVPGGAARAAEAAWSGGGRPLGRLAVRVAGDHGEAVDSAQVEARDGNGARVLATRVGPEGAAVLALPAGRWRIDAVDPRRGRSETREVHLAAGGDARLEFRLHAPARLSLAATGAGGAAIPARWTLVDGASDASAPAGEVGTDASVRTLFTGPGGETVEVPAGKYRVIASHGFAYEAWTASLDLRPGGSASLRPALEPLAFPPGWIAFDAHVLTDASPGCVATPGDRLRQLAADAVDRFAIAGPGADAGAGGLPMSEVDAPGTGRFSGYPAGPSGFAELSTAGAGPLLAVLRRDGALAQVNLPRPEGEGYFQAQGLDPGALAAAPESLLAFDALELLSGRRPGGLPAYGKAWSSLLAARRSVAAVAGSDLDGLAGDRLPSPVTYVRTGSDAPLSLVSALRAGRTEASAGAFARLTLLGAEVGDTVRTAAGPAMAHVTVIAPRWVRVSRVTVLVDGEVNAVYMTRGSDRPVRFDEDVQLELNASGFISVRVEGDADLEWALPGVRPPELSTSKKGIAVSGPIWVDIPRATR